MSTPSQIQSQIENIPGLLCFWDFQEEAGKPRRAKGPHSYELREKAGPVERVEGGLFGPYAAFIRPRQWLSIPRAACPALNLHGPKAQVTVAAWIKRHRKPEIECEFVAGIWNETQARRQYGLFLDLRIHQSADQVAGHVSGLGGPSPGERWCMDAAIGACPVGYFDEWYCVAFTYDGAFAAAFHNGVLDAREDRNPYAYPLGIFDAGEQGGDFTVGAVDRLGSIGNYFTGVVGGVAVFDRALGKQEMALLGSALPGR